MNQSKRAPAAASVPDPPGPPARYTIGGPGRGEVERKRTRWRVIVRPSSGFAWLAGTVRYASSAATCRFFPDRVSKVIGWNASVGCWAAWRDGIGDWRTNAEATANAAEMSIGISRRRIAALDLGGTITERYVQL